MILSKKLYVVQNPLMPGCDDVFFVSEEHAYPPYDKNGHTIPRGWLKTFQEMEERGEMKNIEPGIVFLIVTEQNMEK